MGELRNKPKGLSYYADFQPHTPQLKGSKSPGYKRRKLSLTPTKGQGGATPTTLLRARPNRRTTGTGGRKPCQGSRPTSRRMASFIFILYQHQTISKKKNKRGANQKRCN